MIKFSRSRSKAQTLAKRIVCRGERYDVAAGQIEIPCTLSPLVVIILILGKKLMKKDVKHILALVVATVFALMAGCSEPGPQKEAGTYLLRTDVITVTPESFEAALELKRAAYPYNITETPDEYNQMVIHLVEILSEEIVLLSEAKIRGIVVTDEEAAAAEAEFKKDYPGDSFDQMLLTSAISYAFWKKQFVRDLIIEKLVAAELEGKIEISPDDIVQFYETMKAQKKQLAPNDPDVSEIDETQLVSRLRMRKTEEYYTQWIQSLGTTHPVDINKKALKKFMIHIETGKGKAE